jgi:hypothetical protein
MRLGEARIFLSLLLTVPLGAFAAPFVWPLSGSSTPDPMHTSFGPRINRDSWDFHDGLDLPARKGTPVKAIADGDIFLLGPGGVLDFSSNFVLLRTWDAKGDTLYAAYVHLDWIAADLAQGKRVPQGHVLGGVGSRAATYDHLHFEIRRNSPLEIASEHPLKTLPYTDSPNFGAAGGLRYGYENGDLVLRAVFSAPDRREGDLAGVEVDIRRGATVLEARRVDFSDKATINEGLGDEFQWKNDISVEGYQYSNMTYAGYGDLQYGVLLRRLPAGADELAIRVIDVAGNVSASGIALKGLGPRRSFAHGFEEALEPKDPWVQTITVGGGRGVLQVARRVSAQLAVTGQGFGVFEDQSSDEKAPQAAALALSPDLRGRHRLSLQGQFQAASLSLGPGASVLPMAAWSRKGLAAAAAIRNVGGAHHAGVMVQRPDQSLAGAVGRRLVPLGRWLHWRLELSRLETRQSIAVLLIDGEESARFHWDSLARPIESFRFGIARSAPGVKARLLGDDFEVGDD